MADPSRQPTAPPRPALIRLCQWLWPGFRYFWLTIVFSGFVVGILIAIVTTKGFSISGTPLESIPDHLPLVLAGGGLLIVLTGVVWYLGRPVASSTRALPTPKDREELIRRLSDEYRRQMAQSLQKAAMKSLEGQEPTAVTHSSASLVSWRMDVPGKPSLAAPTPIVEAYNQASAGLLILGDPGVGKSTLLLELALGLLTLAEPADSTQRVPVLVNLSSWALNKHLLTTWLEEQLHSMCGIQRHLTHGWIEQNDLLLLLDGLDEMEPSARSACATAINAYRKGAEHLVSLVVCSRRDEYLALAQEEKLKLLDTVEVQRLTPEQVEGYLEREGEPLEVVRAALRSNPILRELVNTPLLLSMVILTYQGKTVEDLPRYGSAEDQRRQVFTHYVTRKLEPPTKPGVTRKWRYTPSSTQTWLISLAKQMKQTQFFVEEMQLDWLGYSLLHRLVFRLVTWIVIGFVVMLLLALTYIFTDIIFYHQLFLSGPGLLNSFRVYFIVGLLVALPSAISVKINPVERLEWSWRPLRTTWGCLWSYVAIVGTLFFLVFWLTGFHLNESDKKGVLGLLGVVLLGVFIGVMRGISGKDLKKGYRVRPNEGIWRSAQNSVLIGLICIPICGLFLSLFYGLSPSSGEPFSRALLDGLFTGLLLAPLIGLFRGGTAFLKHFILRLFLWRNGAMPWHYVRFLEEATERKLLQSVGGGYCFIHQLLQEYFASLRTETTASAQSHLPSPQP